MTLVARDPARAEVEAPDSRTSESVRPRSRAERVALPLLLAGTALLYLWNLSISGWANPFYSAAAQAGASDWIAMLFGSSDPANAITVDKTPDRKSVV